MNKDRRKRIEKVIEQLQGIVAEIEEIKSEEEQAIENLPENLQEGSNALEMQINVDELDEAYNNIESTIVTLEEVVNK